MIPPRPEATIPTERSLPGRAVRLHFCCRAELPIGSHLCVTGSTVGDRSTSMQSLFANSVEMVTTPDTYPVWKTRQPVVVVLNRHAATKKAVQRHYYRYLMVSPVTNPLDVDDVPGVVVTTEKHGTSVLMEWENPTGAVSSSKPAPMAASSSLTGMAEKVDYHNLPYRTLDILVATANIAEVVQDVWNRSEDATFQPYLIREAIHEEKRRKLQISSNVDNMVVDIAHDASMEQDATPGDDDDEPSSGKLPSSGRATPPAFSKSSRLFFVCFHLPVVVVKNNQGEWQASWSESILARTEGSKILSTYSAYWLGTVSTHPPLESDADREIVRDILKKMNCIPIFLDPAMRQSHYFGFCKQVLWPAFHNIDMLDLSTCGWLSDPNKVASDWDQSRLDDWWNAYYAVNKEFLNHMATLIRAGDIIWIHDYHLSLLPEMLATFEMERYNVKLSKVVFFLHIPFPTSQIFRELECGEKILKGMLHADVVGFHAFDHAKRILGLNYESLVGGLIGVDYQGRTVLVSMSNVSIEPRMVDAALQLPSVQKAIVDLKTKHKNLTIIGGVDIGQRLSGTSLKLLAYERLLQDCPNYHHEVVMVQRLVLPGSRRADEDLTVREVRSLVQRIKERFGESVIDYQEIIGTSVPMDQRLALWKASDIMMSTPIREALNHWPMEFIYTHKDESPGVVITSEFSAVCSILNGALRVNPYDIQASKATIDKALSMSATEREGRRYRDIDFVSNSQSDMWVKNVLRDLRDATSARNASGGSESNSQMSTPLATPNVSRKMHDNTASGFLSREINQAFARLHVKDLAKAFACTQRRVIILDFNGTIVLKEPPGKYLKREILGTSGNKPPPEVVDALGKLCSDPKNTVYVVSGDSSENVVNALGHVPTLGLAVSNGACFSPPVHNSFERSRWLTFDLGVDWDAVKKVALPVLSKYTARSNGSFVKLTSFSIGWSYYSCDPEWGTLQASHLVMELERELRSFDVRFVTLKGIVEIVPRMLDKGLIVKKVLYDTARNQDMEGTGVDFVLCLGDDVSDEKMFSSVYSFAAELDDYSSTSGGVPRVFDEDGMYDAQDDIGVTDSNAMDTTSSVIMPDPAYIFTVAVGKKPTQANTYVNDAQEVADALFYLANGEFPKSRVPGWGGDETSQMFD